jgi:hypothetical protein
LIAYLELPIPGIYTVNGHDVLIVAIVAGTPNDGDPQISVVYVDQDGSMGQARLSEINVNWRYDDDRHKWIDVNTGEDLESDDDGDSV